MNCILYRDISAAVKKRKKIKLKNGNLYGRNIYKSCDFSRNPQNKEVEN